MALFLNAMQPFACPQSRVPQPLLKMVHEDLRDLEEMGIRREDAQAVLHGCGGDPDVVGRNRRARLPQRLRMAA